MSDSRLLPLLYGFINLAIAASAVLAVRALYRLSFHPLAKFPGPKLAAVTSLYGAYLDIIKGGDDCYIKLLPKLHDQYGTLLLHPIIEIFCSHQS